MRIVKYTSEPYLRNPILLIQTLWSDLKLSHELAIILFVRDVKARYRQSFLGIIWLFIPPLIMTVVVLLARNSGVIQFGETPVAYAAYVMLSMVLWQTFSDSLNGPIEAMEKSRNMLLKLHFPREALLLAKFLEVILDFLVRFVLAICIFVYFDLGIGSQVILFPFALLTMIVFGFALGMMLAPISILYTDISKGIKAGLMFWMFLTPVIYPQPESGLLSVIVDINPVTHLLGTTRELMVSIPLTNITMFSFYAVLTWLGIFFAWLGFRIMLPFAIERVGS